MGIFNWGHVAQHGFWMEESNYVGAYPSRIVEPQKRRRRRILSICKQLFCVVLLCIRK